MLLPLLLIASTVHASRRLRPSELLQLEEHNHAQSEMKIQQLQSIQDLSNLLDEGRQKLAGARIVIRADPTPSSTPGSASGSSQTSSITLPTPPPQLEPLALPSYGGPVSQIDELTDIQREQNSLQQKKLMVAQQKRIIEESQASSDKLQQLIAVNKQIEQKNEQALAEAGDHLLQRVKAYSDRLSEEQTQSSTSGGASGAAAPAAAASGGAALIEEQRARQKVVEPSSAVVLDPQRLSEIQQQINDQRLTIQELQSQLMRRRRRRWHRRFGDEEENAQEQEGALVDQQQRQ